VRTVRPEHVRVLSLEHNYCVISLTTEFMAVSSNWIAIDMYLAQSVVVFLGKDRNVYNCCRFVGLSLPLIYLIHRCF